MDEQQRYHAFLVRVWAVRHGGNLTWRASATDAHTNEQHAFREIGGLCTFLAALTEDEPAVALAAGAKDVRADSSGDTSPATGTGNC